MDANGLTFFQLADAAHWRGQENTRWDADCRALGLASRRSLDAPIDAAAFAIANGAIDSIPRALDRLQSVARWDEPTHAIVVRSHLPEDAVLLALAERPSDFTVASDGVLVIALADALLLHDLRGRFADSRVASPGFAPWRLAADADGAVWLLERSSGRLARFSGRPLPATTPPRDAYAPGVFRPDPENCHPPRIDFVADAAWPTAERPVALAVSPRGDLALLGWGVDGAATLHLLAAESGSLRVPPLERRFAAPLALAGARYAYSLDWLDERRIAVRMPGRRDAPAFDLGPLFAAREDDVAAPSSAAPLGEVYPLARGAPEAPFAHRLDGPPRYPAADGGAEPLLPLSVANRARRGAAAHWRDTPGGLDAHWLDSGSAGTVWHRLYAEASIPAGCGFVVWIAATALPQPPAIDAVDAWHPHGFGDEIASLAPEASQGPVPRAAWERAPSELPGHPGLAPWPAEPRRRGLFGVLIQNPRQRVRKVVGRYLWLRVSLCGDGRSGPEIAALRAWAGRFDYLDHYLPRVYREQLFGAPAEAPGESIGSLPPAQLAVQLAALDAGGAPSAELRTALATLPLATPQTLQVEVEDPGASWRLVDTARRAVWHLRRAGPRITVYAPRATPADFLSRMLANFEGVLTPLEDRVAAAHVLTHPATVPEPQLDWLGAWIGVAFDPLLPAERRRAWLAEAPRLARWHGTRRGLSFALDIASGGAVGGGEIVVIEDFRLRRLLATLLGVDLAPQDDPLLPGLHQSGNSIVGDTLVLGDAERAELLALFRSEVATADENDAVRSFYARLAHRATVLVHQEVEPQDLGLIRRIVELEAPAHVEVRVVSATWPLLVGIASLVGVDTYLGPPRLPRPARVQVSALGMGDLVLQDASLDPRLTGQAAAPVPPSPPRRRCRRRPQRALRRQFHPRWQRLQRRCRPNPRAVRLAAAAARVTDPSATDPHRGNSHGRLHHQCRCRHRHADRRGDGRAEQPDADRATALPAGRRRRRRQPLGRRRSDDDHRRPGRTDRGAASAADRAGRTQLRSRRPQLLRRRWRAHRAVRLDLPRAGEHVSLDRPPPDAEGLAW